MCDACWNCEIFANKVMSQALCSGEEMMTLSMDTLKYNLSQEWMATGKKNFYIFRKAITDPCPALNIDINVSSKTNMNETIRINFV